MPRLQLSLASARAIALDAQGFGADKSARPKTAMDVLDRLGLLQIDTVSVFERAHYMPVFSRIGGFDKRLIEGGVTDGLAEYWAHEASLIRVEDLPLYRFRMDFYRDKWAKAESHWMHENTDFLKWLRDEIGTRGPLTTKQIEHDRSKRKGTWWAWSDVKQGLEYQFYQGDLVIAGRSKFSRQYALPEQVLAPEVLAALKAKSADHNGARVELARRASKSLGIGTVKDIADWYRFRSQAQTQKIVDELVAEGLLRQVSVEGWKAPAYLHRDYVDSPLLDSKTAMDAAAASPTTILSPFDPLVWNRDRDELLWNFFYRIEIYTPAPKRQYGYYTLPILHRGQIVGRIDLKSDRPNSTLRANASWHEPWVTQRALGPLAKALAANLKVAAKWQGLDRISIEPVGNLAAELAKHC